ncbi:MAG: TlpA family protein disulfide reductase [Bacteroidia bacterium]|nr:TlpA family protein disulfide reductase [Bacteroidia bacterium]
MYKYILLTATMALFSCSNSEKAIPDFNFETVEGASISSNDLKGKATILVVWATWCGDCIREIPELNELAKKYENNENVDFVAFSDEDVQTINNSLEKYPFNFKQVPNSKSFSDQIKSGLVKHFPQVMVLNKALVPVFEVTENKEPIFDVLDKHIQDIIR